MARRKPLPAAELPIGILDSLCPHCGTPLAAPVYARFLVGTTVTVQGTCPSCEQGVTIMDQLANVRELADQS